MEGNKIYTLEKFQFWIEDGIANVCYNKGCIVTLDFAKEIVQLMIKVHAGNIYPGIAYIHDTTVMTTEARKYLAKEAYFGITKAALITSSNVKATIANLHILFDNPVKPTRHFTNKQDAMKWLRKE